MRSLALACIVVLSTMSPARAAVADVVVQAGHQGRPASCVPNHVKACNIGASSAAGREIDWTPVVADAMAAALRQAGLRVIRRPADYPEHDTAKVAIFIHFDGAEPACASGASIGYPATTPAAFAAAWKTAYGKYYPFRFAGENITPSEHQYYGFHKVDAPVKMLIEYGEITCPAQAAWLHPRLTALGTFTARFVEGRMP
jgi:hypothetical protein